MPSFILPELSRVLECYCYNNNNKNSHKKNLNLLPKVEVKEWSGVFSFMRKNKKVKVLEKVSEVAN